MIKLKINLNQIVFLEMYIFNLLLIFCTDVQFLIENLYNYVISDSFFKKFQNIELILLIELIYIKIN